MAKTESDTAEAPQADVGADARIAALEEEVARLRADLERLRAASRHGAPI